MYISRQPRKGCGATCSSQLQQLQDSDYILQQPPSGPATANISPRSQTVSGVNMGYVRQDNYPTKGHRGLLHQNVDPQQPQGPHPKSEGGVKLVRASSEWVMVDGMLLHGMVHRAIGVE